MNDAESTPQLTSLLDNELLAYVERLRIQPTRRRTNRAQGEHLAGKGGSSIELSDYRDYVPGDDVRFVDWNIFARHHRPYMKLYEHEEDMHVVVLIDVSASMAFENKFDCARQLAAAFGVMALMGLERLSIYAIASEDSPPTFLKPCIGRVNMQRMLSFIEDLQPGGDRTIDETVDAVLRRHRGRGVAILLSDFLTPNRMDRPLNLLFSAGLEVFAVQVLGPDGDRSAADRRCAAGGFRNGQHARCFCGGASARYLSRAACRAGPASGTRLPTSERTVPECVGGFDRKADSVGRHATPGVDTMSWPQFFAPSWAWLFLLAVPVVVFYFLKLKRPRVEVPSLALWGQVIQDRRVNSPFQRFKRNLLLLAQLLLLALLVLAAMQPFIDSSAENSEYLAVIVDASASMAGTEEDDETTRLEEAKKKVGRLIDQMLPDQRVSLISIGPTARRLTDFTNNRRVLREALDKIEVYDVPGELEGALRMTQALARTVPVGRAILFSDGNFPEKVDFELPFELVYQQLPAAGPNVGITALSARSNRSNAWDVFVRIEASTPDPLATGVELIVDGDTQEQKTVVLKDKKPRRLAFSLAADQAASVEVRLSPEQSDSIKADNSALLEITPLRPLMVKIDPELTAFRHAINPRKDVVIAGDEAGPSDSGTFDLLITKSAAAERPEARVVLTIGEVPPDLKSLIRIEEAAGEVVDWDRHCRLLEHVLLSDMVLAEEPQAAEGVDDGALEALGYDVLAHGRRGPLIVRKLLGAQTQYFVLFDTDASTLPYRVGFPVLVSNLLRVAIREAGLAELAAHKTSTLRLHDLSAETDFTVRNPQGDSRTTKSDANGSLTGISAPYAGWYEVLEDSDLVTRVGASLLDSQETTLNAVEEIQFREVPVSAATSDVRTDFPLWEYLTLLAFAVLLFEWWLYCHRPVSSRSMMTK